MCSRPIRLMKQFFHRQQPKQALKLTCKAGIGGVLSVAILSGLSTLTGNAFLMAPFGATCVLLFSLPNSPLSQPINVIAGHCISTAIGLILCQFLPLAWWSLGLAVGLAIFMMALLRVTHPPAGADPLVVFFGGLGWEYLLFPVLLGSVLLTLMAAVFHKIPPSAKYPT